MKKKIVILTILIFLMTTRVSAAGNIEISKETLEMPEGKSEVLKITANNCAGKIEIVPIDSTIAGVSKSEFFFDTSLDEKEVEVVVKALKKGNTQIEIRFADVATFDYEELTGKLECSVNVLDKEITITGSNYVDVGSEITLEASISDDSELIWSSSDTTIATVDNGVVKGLNDGIVTITVSSATDDSIYKTFEIEIKAKAIGDVPKTLLSTNIIVYIAFFIMMMVAGWLFYASYKKVKA